MNIYRESAAGIHVKSAIKNLISYTDTIGKLLTRDITMPLQDYMLDCVGILFDYGKVQAIHPEIWGQDARVSKDPRAKGSAYVFEVAFLYPELDNMRMKLVWYVSKSQMGYYFGCDTGSGLSELLTDTVQAICRKNLGHFVWVKR
jgi:hypothetical protein